MKNLLPAVVLVFGLLSVYGQDEASASFRKDGFTNEKVKFLIPEVSGDLKLDSAVYHTWDAFKNRFINNYKDDYSYDENNHLVLTLHSNWDNITGIWKDNYKVEVFYNENGNKLSRTTYYWTESTSSWDINNKSEYFQDQNNNDTLSYTYSWDTMNNDWLPRTKRIWDYSPSQKLSKETVLYKLTPDAPWDSAFEFTFYKDEHDLDTLSLIQAWDFDTHHRMFLSKQNIYYDMAGKDTLEINYDYSAESSDWVNFSKVSTTEDVTGNGSTAYSYLWNTNPDKWEFDMKYVLARDTVRYTEATYMYERHNDFWLESSLANYYYSPYLVTGIENPPETRNLVYPNPARGYISVDSKDIEDPVYIEFYTTQGKKVLVKPVYGKDEISLDDLREGMYIYKIIGKETSTSGKLLVE